MPTRRAWKHSVNYEMEGKINANMQVSEQCRIAAYKDNQIVRPHLEYCIQAWRPYLRKDIIYMLEKYKGEQLNSFRGLDILAKTKD